MFNGIGILSWQCQEPVVVLLAALLQGLYIGWVIRKAFGSDRSMTMTCMLLPCVVSCALLVINGSLGTGIAILGVFGLVRFRSLPGQGTDILGVFFAMSCGLMASTGYLVSALILCFLIGLAFLFVSKLAMDTMKTPAMVRITLSEEEADFEKIEQAMSQYGKVKMLSLKTSHMGTLYEAAYEMQWNKDANPAKLCDAVRALNGNLPVQILAQAPSVIA